MGCSTGHLQCQCEAVFPSPGIYYAPSTNQSVITPAPAPISTFCNSYSRATVRPGFESVSLVLGSNLITVIGHHRIRLFWNPMGTSQIISRLRGDNWETLVFCDLRCLVSELSFVTMRWRETDLKLQRSDCELHTSLRFPLCHLLDSCIWGVVENI